MARQSAREVCRALSFRCSAYKYTSVYLYLVIPTAQATKHRKCMDQSFARGASMSHGKFLTTNHKSEIQYDMTMIEVKMQVGFDKAVLGL